MNSKIVDADSEYTKTLLGIWNAHFWDSAKLFAQAWAFYVTIMAALVGYVVSQKVSQQLSNALILVAAIISFIHLVVSSLWAWGLWHVVVTLEALTRCLNEKKFADLSLNLKGTFNRWKFSQMVIVFSGALIAFVMLVGLILLLHSNILGKP